MNKEVRKFLIENVAQFKTTITYQSLCDQCELSLDMRGSEYDRAEIGRILGEISRFEHKHKRPLLSSLVVTKLRGYEGDGFYKLCEELDFGSWELLRDDKTFHEKQVEKCWKFWTKEVNRKKFVII